MKMKNRAMRNQETVNLVAVKIDIRPKTDIFRP